MPPLEPRVLLRLDGRRVLLTHARTPGEVADAVAVARAEYPAGVRRVGIEQVGADAVRVLDDRVR